MKLPFPLRRENIGKVLPYLSEALLAGLLSGARVFDSYAPFAVGAVAAAGTGWGGLSALLGAGLGALVLLDFPHALRTMACALLIYTANNAFCELRAYRRPWFLPVMTAGLMLSVEVIYLLRSGDVEEAAFCLLSVLLAALFAHCRRLTRSAVQPWQEHPTASLMVLLGILTALASAQLQSGFAPGRIAAVLTVLLLTFDREPAFALTAALCIGLAMDSVTPGGTYLYAACYSLCALLTGLTFRGRRVRAACMFALSTALFALPLGTAQGIVLLYEGLAGTLLFLLLPSRVLLALHEEPPRKDEAGLRRRLREAAAGLHELHEGIVHTPRTPEENPAVIFDRTAEAVCRDCTLRELCWEREYGRTYNAFNDATAALLQNGQARGEDFPAYFSDRCIRLSGFLSALNGELHAFLLRRQYRSRLVEAHSQAAGQYAQLSELLTQAAEEPAACPTPLLAYRVGKTLRPRDGQSVSGDCAAAFETDTGRLCLLLSDGMGSGEEARFESALAVRLLERFLRAGIDAPPALRTLNSALNLRAEESDSFTTVDLLILSLASGEGELYKYGAAPSYIKQGNRVRRVSGSCLPVGLAAERQRPESTHIRLGGGSCFVMVTDGVADSADDGWLEALLTEWTGEDPQMLVASILAESRSHKGGTDDAGVLALYLPAGILPEEV